jgi:hypothetical protein
MSSLTRKQDHPKVQVANHRQKHWWNLMTKISFHFTLGAMLSALCVPASAQQPAKIPGIGFLTGGGDDSARNEALRQGLRELGYIEGRTLSLSGVLQKQNLVASPCWRLSWCISK